MNPNLLTAFFMGVLTSEKPLNFDRAIKELSKTDDVDATAAKALWAKCEANPSKERQAMLKIKPGKLEEEIAMLSEIGDYFLMGLTVSGTDVEEMKNEELSELLVEMEDHLLLLDEWMAEGEEGKPSAEWADDGKKYKSEFLEIWKELEEELAT